MKFNKLNHFGGQMSHDLTKNQGESWFVCLFGKLIFFQVVRRIQQFSSTAKPYII